VSLRRWIRRADAPPELGVASILPVCVTPAPAALVSSVDDASLVEIVRNDGIRVRFAVGTDVSYIATLIERMH